MAELFAAIGAFLASAKPFVGAALCLLGGGLAVVGAVGVLRFPDFYTRLHAAGVIDTSSATALLVGMALLAPDWLTIFKLAVIWVFLFITGPTASHAIANAAHTAGLTPLIGRGARGEPEPEEPR